MCCGDDLNHVDVYRSSGILDDSECETQSQGEPKAVSPAPLATPPPPTTKHVPLPRANYSDPTGRAYFNRNDRESIDEGVRMRLRSAAQGRDPEK